MIQEEGSYVYNMRNIQEKPGLHRLRFYTLLYDCDIRFLDSATQKLRVLYFELNNCEF
jgi:hypothetical protein